MSIHYLKGNCKIKKVKALHNKISKTLLENAKIRVIWRTVNDNPWVNINIYICII